MPFGEKLRVTNNEMKKATQTLQSEADNAQWLDCSIEAVISQ